MKREIFKTIICAQTDGMMVMLCFLFALLFFSTVKSAKRPGLRNISIMYGTTLIYLLWLYLQGILVAVSPTIDTFFQDYQTFALACNLVLPPLVVVTCSLLTKRHAFSLGWLAAHVAPFVVAALIALPVNSIIYARVLIGVAIAYGVVMTILVLIAAFRYTRAAEQEYSSLEGRSFRWLIGMPFVLFAELALFMVYIFNNHTEGWLALYQFVSVGIWLYFLIGSTIMLNRRAQLEVDLDKYDKAMLSDVSEQKATTLNEAELEAFRNLLRKNCEETELYLKEDLTREDLAAAMMTNHTYLTQRLMAATGSNFYTYINRLRVMHAQTLIMEHPDWSLDRIGIESGYRNHATFYSAFRRILDTTPAEWKAKALGDGKKA